MRTVGQLKLESEALLQKVEDAYYEQVDQFFVQLDEKDDIPVMNLEFFPFSFMEDWELGNLDSAEVWESLCAMDYKEAAKNKLTKKLVNLMIKHDHIAGYVKPTINAVLDNCQHDLIKYLECLEDLFGEYAKIDDEQVQLTWIEQKFRKNGEVVEDCYELSINQIVRQISNYICPNLKKAFHVSEHVVVFDEVKDEERTVSWFFGPASYMDVLRSEFGITEKLSSSGEYQMLKTIMESA